MNKLLILLLSLLAVSLEAATITNWGSQLPTAAPVGSDVILMQKGGVTYYFTPDQMSTYSFTNLKTLTSNSLAFSLTSTSLFPAYNRAASGAFNITASTNEDINLINRGAGMVTISGGWGLGFHAPSANTGPEFGANIGGISFRQRTESLSTNFFLFRGGEYIFEDQVANWKLAIMASGVNVGSVADNTLVPVSRFEVSGNASIGPLFARLAKAPTNGLAVQGSVLIGRTNALDEANGVKLEVVASTPTGQDQSFARFFDINKNRGIAIGTHNAEASIQAFAPSDSSLQPLFVQPLGGAFGVGTTNAINKLDVEGGFAVGTNYSGTSAAPANGGIIEGNVGIGTANTSLGARLELFGTGDPIIRYRRDLATDTGMDFAANNTGANLKVVGSQQFDLFVDALSRLTVASGGNVGIGTTTPSSSLDVTGQVRSVSAIITNSASLMAKSFSAPASTAFTTSFGAHLWSDGTNLCVVLENSAGGRTTNKVSMTAWP